MPSLQRRRKSQDKKKTQGGYDTTYHSNKYQLQQHPIFIYILFQITKIDRRTSNVGTGGSMLFNFFTATFINDKNAWAAATSKSPVFRLKKSTTTSEYLLSHWILFLLRGECLGPETAMSNPSSSSWSSSCVMGKCSNSGVEMAVYAFLAVGIVAMIHWNLSFPSV